MYFLIINKQTSYFGHPFSSSWNRKNFRIIKKKKKNILPTVKIAISSVQIYFWSHASYCGCFNKHVCFVRCAALALFPKPTLKNTKWIGSLSPIYCGKGRRAFSVVAATSLCVDEEMFMLTRHLTDACVRRRAYKWQSIRSGFSENFRQRFNAPARWVQLLLLLLVYYKT